MPPYSSKIGIVGVGRMGSNIARCLKNKRFKIVTVYDILPRLAKNLATEVRAEASSSLARVAELADVIITVVPDDKAMRRIFLSRGDNLLKNPRDKLYINCATVSPKIHLEVEKQARKRGARTLEACMASSIVQAREGNLYLICSGRREIYQAALPILRAMSPSPRYVGPTGNAAKIKALVNMVMNINTVGLAEGLGLGHALGIDLNLLREIFSQTGANSQVLATDGLDMQNREHHCYFSATHAAKDSGIALHLAAEKNLTLPLARVTKKQYDRMIHCGWGEMDKSGVAELTFRGRGKCKASRT